ncbi:phage holin family protein [Thalassospira marina]|uniref:phage holin family protein n=1 Tax=Thalassospira marina TaxID=2048283 RepID=UPI0010543538|nr:phage holin family protein [Thalassospira marina]
MFDKPPHEIETGWLSALKMWGLILTFSLYGRLLYHRYLVSKGYRKFWSWDLLWEVLTAGFCAVMSAGVADYLKLETFTACAVASILGWLGPRGLQVLIADFRNTSKNSKE